MDFSIREATQKDYTGLCVLFAEGDVFHREALADIFQESKGSARTKVFISSIIANENAILFVAEYDSQIIGFVHILIREAPNVPYMVPRNYAVIDSLVVKKECRRSGIGQSLVKRAHQWALNKGVTQVELNVWEFNKGAIAFYEKLGYTIASRRMWKKLK